MAKVGILSQHADVTVMINQLLTPGHEVLSIERPLTQQTDVACVPDLVILPLFRKADAVARPIGDFEEDVVGGHLLRDATRLMDGHRRPIIVFGIGVNASEMPDDVHFHAYLTFPQAIQELNPLFSSIVGPAADAAEATKAKSD
jgi:hypothetical protein